MQLKDFKNAPRIENDHINAQKKRHFQHHAINRLAKLRHADELTNFQKYILAYEGLYNYAPIAKQIGLKQIAAELEDLSFRHFQPAVYDDIAKRLDAKEGERKLRIDQLAWQLQSELDQSGIKCIVLGRPKHIYSIFCKMQYKGIGFEDVYDKYALRVLLFTQLDKQFVLDEQEQQQYEHRVKELCYRTLHIVHNFWNHIPAEFDDYVEQPKPNGYQSLHTTVFDSSGELLEVQIRTDVMHAQAEYGSAAHWAYKETVSTYGDKLSIFCSH